MSKRSILPRIHELGVVGESDWRAASVKRPALSKTTLLAYAPSAPNFGLAGCLSSEIFEVFWKNLQKLQPAKCKVGQDWPEQSQKGCAAFALIVTWCSVKPVEEVELN